ncbi:MAG: LPS assembly lipoprotein LptE [Legionellales bacterium]
MKKRFIPLLLISLLLSACGFHLRGMIDVPKWLTNVAISSKSNDLEFVSMLKSTLEGYHIEVNPEPALAHYWLIINHVTYQRQIVSVGASTNPRQYQLTLSVGYMLQTRKGQIIKASRQVSVSRQLTVNNDRILGSNDEETILINEMRQEAVVQLINRLGSVKLD